MGLMIIYFDAMIKARVGEKQTDNFFWQFKTYKLFTTTAAKISGCPFELKFLFQPLIYRVKPLKKSVIIVAPCILLNTGKLMSQCIC